MRKFIIIALIASMAIVTLSACGIKSTGANKDNSVKSNVNNSNSSSNGENKQKVNSPKDGPSSTSGNLGGIYKTAGDELTDFANALQESEEAFDKVIDSGKTDDMAELDAFISKSLPGLALISLPQYDMLPGENLPKKEGKMMLSGYEGVREKSGDEIKFSASYTATEDSNIDKKGDKYSEKGSLNTKTNTLVLESNYDRGGKTITHIVFEAVILKDGTYIIQYLKAANSLKEDASIDTSGVFKRYNKNEYVAVISKFDGKMDFKYDSIVGKGDLQPDTMAKNYKVTGKFTVKDGKSVFSK